MTSQRGDDIGEFGSFRPLRPPPRPAFGRIVELSGPGAPCGGCPRDVFRRVETALLRPCVPDPMGVVVSSDYPCEGAGFL